jgi:hypothetical protein
MPHPVAGGAAADAVFDDVQVGAGLPGCRLDAVECAAGAGRDVGAVAVQVPVAGVVQVGG